MLTLLDDIVINLVDVLGFDELCSLFFECGESVANAMKSAVKYESE